jgi:DNA-binding XRE family transcriptional regulator
MTDDVTFVRGNERIKRLAKRPDIAAGVRQTRQQMAEADRRHADGLAALRRAAALTQATLAERLGVSQAAISQVEQRQDMLLSTLSGYLEAMGGHATVIVTFDDGRWSSTSPASPRAPDSSPQSDRREPRVSRQRPR